MERDAGYLKAPCVARDGTARWNEHGRPNTPGQTAFRCPGIPRAQTDITEAFLRVARSDTTVQVTLKRLGQDNPRHFTIGTIRVSVYNFAIAYLHRSRSVEVQPNTCTQ